MRSGSARLIWLLVIALLGASIAVVAETNPFGLLDGFSASAARSPGNSDVQSSRPRVLRSPSQSDGPHPTGRNPVRPATRPVPSPSLSPDDVVRIEMTALQYNDDPSPDAGMAIVFDFASPANKVRTGPLAKFIRGVKTPTYAPMIGCKSVKYWPPAVKDGNAEEMVDVKDSQGIDFYYVFQLSKQADPQYLDCWMTDGAGPIAPPQSAPPPESNPDAAPAIPENQT
jgi:hypothetical protein